MPNRLARTLLAGAALLLSACMSAPGAVPSPEPPELEGTQWTVTSIRGTDTVAEAQPTIDFAGGQMTGSSGCNSFFGPFTQDRGDLTLGPAGATMMACAEEAVMTQENDLFTAFGDVAGIRAADGGAELVDASGEVVMVLKVREPVPDKPLEGTEWKLTTIVEGETASSIVGDRAVTLTIADGKLHAQACNTLNGDIVVDGQSVTVGPLMSTRMACPSEEETVQEGKLLSYLEGAKSYAISGTTLTLTAGSDQLVFEAVG